MAFSNTFDTTNPGSATGNREDLQDVLTILAPEETPILSSGNREKANATFVETVVDALAAPSTAGIDEGTDVTSFTDQFSGRAKIGNYIQLFRRDYQVSNLQEAADSVGPAKLAQAEAKAMREIKRDIEATLCSTNDRASEDGAGQAYQLRGLGDWIDSAGPADVPAAYRTPADSIHATGAFSEETLNDLITSVYRVTGSTNNLTLFADTALRREISDFSRTSAAADATVRSVNYDGNSANLTLSVEMYQSDHGIVSIVNMNPDCAPDTTNKDTGYLINPDYYSIQEFIPLGSQSVENRGGGNRGFVDCALTLGMKHPGAHGKITAIA